MNAPYLLVLIPGTAWVTGNLMLGIIAAKTLFAQAPAPMAAVGPDQISRAMAGDLFGSMLLQWYGLPLTLLCLTTCIGLGWLAGLAKRAGKRLTAGALIAAFVALALLHRQTVHVIQEVGNQAQQLAKTPPEAAEVPRLAFQRAHLQSEQLVKLETLVVLVLTIGTAVALVRRRPPKT